LNGDISNDLDGTLTSFQGHGIFEVKYLKTVHLRDKATIDRYHTESIEWYHFRLTLDRDFTVVIYLDTIYLRNDTR